MKAFFDWKNPISRSHYFFFAVLLFIIKYPLDLIVARLFDVTWLPYYYFSILNNPLFKNDLATQQLWAAMMTVALPFLVTGIILNLRRVRTIGLPPLFALSILLPFINGIFFLFFCIMKDASEQGTRTKRFNFLDHELNLGRKQTIFLGLALTITYVLIGTLLAMKTKFPFTESTLVLLPFISGFLTILIMLRVVKLSPGSVIVYSNLPFLSVLLLLLAFTIEGLLCVSVIYPVVFILCSIGGLFAFYTFRKKIHTDLKSVLIIFPLLYGLELAHDQGIVKTSVTSEVIINASKEDVWKNVVQFSEINQPWEGIILALVPKLLKAEIDGEGIGVMRRCIFDQGTFYEPIIEWRPPHKLTFGVDRGIPRFDKYGRTTRGQFLIEDAGPGKIKLIGTTWYEISIGIPYYWKLWGDYFIHKIHMRALSHIKSLSEKQHQASFSLLMTDQQNE